MLPCLIRRLASARDFVIAQTAKARTTIVTTSPDCADKAGSSVSDNRFSLKRVVHSSFALRATELDVAHLIGPTEFNVRFYHHRIVGLHDRVLNFVRMNRLLVFDPVAKIFPLQQLLQSHVAVEPDYVFER